MKNAGWIIFIVIFSAVEVWLVSMSIKGLRKMIHDKRSILESERLAPPGERGE